MKTNGWKVFCLWGCLVGAGFLPRAAVAQVAPDYLEALDRSVYMEQADLRMELYKDGEVVRWYEMTFFRKGDKMRMEFTGPATEKGRRMLNDNTSLWMYLPRTSKVMKLPFKQSFMGSDASNTDLMRMAFQKDYKITRTGALPGGLVELELKAVNLEVAYDKVIVWFDPVKKVPVKQEMYSLSDKLIKTLCYETCERVEGSYIPATFSIREELKKHTLTRMYYTHIRKKGAKPDAFFTLASLKR